ncbi:GTPase of the mitochondrial inner membrane that associates with the large ribosomal subunit [Yamadazyma tenuis]|nr:GTPase of the mitochondrial inner membrane that associates with the large ribosomal subunit [Yamadazyma tenuis]
MGSLHRIRRTYVAKGGQPGKGSQLDGKRGEDVLIEVPKGTTLRWIPDPLVLRESFKTTNKQSTWLEILTSYSGQYIQFFRNSFKPGEGWLFSEHDEEYFKERDFFVKLDETVQGYDQEIINEELTEDYFPILGMDLDDVTDKPILLLKGGRGGMGNMNFLTKDVRNPRFAKKGRDGNVQFFLLELKLIADLGLVGLPNAGKSSLLRSISRARPRVGHWEFTTLQPTIGTIYTTIDKDPFTVADIPGIIKGASENKGMGLDFLRHIERCKGLVFVVSLEKSPIEDLRILIEELGETKLKNKRKLIIATKADLNDNNKTYTKFKEYIETHLNIEGEVWNIVPVCAPQNQNIEKCIALMSQIA